MEDACSLYEQTIAIEKGKEQSHILPFLYAQYSRFLYLVSQKHVFAKIQFLQSVMVKFCYINSLTGFEKGSKGKGGSKSGR